ncbi:MAG: TonB-dependent receptor, partial [Catalinimonas sp.]
ELNDNVTISGTWVYGTGNAITLPLAEYEAPGHRPGQPVNFNQNQYYWWQNYEDYGERNGSRMAPYHRLDLGVQFHKQLPRAERTWELSLYNAYSRQNPFFYFLDREYDNQSDLYEVKLKQVALFPLIPSVSYGLKF